MSFAQQTPETFDERPEDRRLRRIERLRELGGSLRRVNGGVWHQSEKRGVLKRSVGEEKAAKRPRSDRKDVQTNLSAAAEAEWEARKKGG